MRGLTTPVDSGYDGDGLLVWSGTVVDKSVALLAKSSVDRRTPKAWSHLSARVTAFAVCELGSSRTSG